MIKKYYETIFVVTETCNNGNERRFKKSVYAETRKGYKNNGLQQRIEAGKKALYNQHYYNIEYVSTKATTIIFED